MLLKALWSYTCSKFQKSYTIEKIPEETKKEDFLGEE